MFYHQINSFTPADEISDDPKRFKEIGQAHATGPLWLLELAFLFMGSAQSYLRAFTFPM